MQLSDLQDVDISDLSSWPHWLRWMMIFLGSILILFSGYKFFIEEEREDLARLEGTEVTLKKSFLSKKQFVVNLPAYQEQMIEIQDRFGEVLRQLPNKTEVPALLVDITQAGLSRGLVFNQFKPGKPIIDDFYMSLPISVDVSGTYHQLAEFISDLAALPRIVTLGDTNISGKSKGDKGELTMKAQLFTYQYVADEVLGESAEPTSVRVGG